MATKYNISITLEDKRKNITKKHFNELAQDHRFENPKELYKIQIFFLGLKKVPDLYWFLIPKIQL